MSASTIHVHDKNYAAATPSAYRRLGACALRARARVRRAHVHVIPNKKFCELKGGNIGILEKAQETRLLYMSPKYSRYIGIAS